MHAQGINILNKADRNHIAVRVPHHFQFQLFPAKNGLLHKDLAHQGSLQPPGTYGPQFVFIVNQAASGSAHGVGRPQNHRVFEPVRNVQCLLHGICHFAPGHLDSQGIHCIFECNPVLAALDGIHLHADNLHLIFFQNSRTGKLRAEIQPGLPSQIGQQCVRTLLCNDLLQPLLVQRLNISHVCHLRIRHNGGRVGIYQYNLISQLFQRLARLGAGIVKLTGLADDNGTGTYNQHFVNVSSLRHILFYPPVPVNDALKRAAWHLWPFGLSFIMDLFYHAVNDQHGIDGHSASPFHEYGLILPCC